MSNAPWDCLYLYFNQVESIYAQIIALQTEQQALPLVVNEDNNASEENVEAPPLDFLPLHEELKSSIALCQESMNSHVTEKEWENLVCALIFHCDETVLTQTLECRANINAKGLKVKAMWPTLQKQLLECRNGGERFFIKLDELLMQPCDFPVAIETYYFCLKQGFKGRYLHQPEKLQSYLEKCSDVITQNLVRAKSQGILQTKRNPKSEPQISAIR